MKKPAHTKYEIHPLLQNRWSPRAFSHEPIDEVTLTKLFEAARWAASWRNSQPWRFIIASREDEEAFERIYDCINPGNQKWAKNAAVLALVFAQLAYDPEKGPNPITYYDTGLAVAQLTVEAMAHNIYIHQMGGIKRGKIREVFEIPEAFTPVVGLAIGKLGSWENLPEEVQAKDRRERKRKSLDKIVFAEKFGNPAGLA